MKALILVVLTTMVYASVAFPQIKEGQAFSNEAINQARNTQLIPKNAYISGVLESREVAAVTSIPGDQSINLGGLLPGVPDDVVFQLKRQIEKIGLN
ncbi:uncharacterized protein [Chelonus insularis]|uniref:uncharacterized protein n=1 Tax=Chelonus insularis TaxID=460826 RepID=UPI00158EF8EF|nr:uncharacterized protein LOC118070723 [Chelonus insularis]